MKAFRPIVIIILLIGILSAATIPAMAGPALSEAVFYVH